MASLLPKKLNEYLVKLESSDNSVLREMEREAKQRKFPIIGPQCGRRMAVLASAIGARSVFEMGSGFGYSTLWFAAAVGRGGLVVHTEYDPENSRRAEMYLKKAKLHSRCRFEVGDALELLKRQQGRFDCILIDVDKHSYPEALAAALPKLRVGGLIFTHNTLWSGRVADRPSDAATKGVQAYNREMMANPELLSYLDPVDDGLAVSLKVGKSAKTRFGL